jgi:catechol 2,3-dioxygenase-like lactoylglutathione lyase family enzyme
MSQQLALTTLLVDDYDRAIAWYTQALGFELRADTAIGTGKRWVVVAPQGSHAGLVLTLASTVNQQGRVGDQTGGRVAFFLHTDDFARDHAAMLARGVRFTEAPRHEPHGIVAIFTDLYGNTWDLLEPAP